MQDKYLRNALEKVGEKLFQLLKTEKVKK